LETRRRDFTPGGRESNPGWPRTFVPYVNSWINEIKKTMASEGGMDKIKALLADLKAKACGELSEAAAGTAPVAEVGQVMDVTLAKAAEQNYAYKGKKQYQPPGKPTKDCETVEGPGAFEDIAKSIKALSAIIEQGEEGDPGREAGEAPESDPKPEAEPEKAEPSEPSDEAPDLASAIKNNLAHGIADGVVSSLAAVFGDPINFADAEVLKAVDEVERQYNQKGRQFFTQLRAELRDIGSVDRDRAVRAAVRVFRELA
jgi:hypothetical protein